MPKSLYIVLSAPSLFGFMKGQPARMRAIGFNPVVIASASDQLDKQTREEGCARLEIDIRRDISPFHDACAFLRLLWLFARSRPTAVLLSGPKAIFLGGMAAWLLGVERRVVVYHGMRQETLRGPLRALIDCCDRISFICATQILAVSPSLREKMHVCGLAEKCRVKVTGNGTANGVDTDYFQVTPASIAKRNKLGEQLGIPPGASVAGFVGRMTEDKGVADLFAAYRMLREDIPELYLVLVGALEMAYPGGRQYFADECAQPRVIWVGAVSDIRPYVQLFNVQIFPSSREGLPLAVVEAAALEVPTVAYVATGLVDAIADGATGSLVEAGDVKALANAALGYLTQVDLSVSRGQAARRRVKDLYSPDSVWMAYQAALSSD